MGFFSFHVCKLHYYYFVMQSSHYSVIVSIYFLSMNALFFFFTLTCFPYSFFLLILDIQLLMIDFPCCLILLFELKQSEEKGK
jgi:hypothetical protein